MTLGWLERRLAKLETKQPQGDPFQIDAQRILDDWNGYAPRLANTCRVLGETRDRGDVLEDFDLKMLDRLEDLAKGEDVVVVVGQMVVEIAAADLALSQRTHAACSGCVTPAA
jgi:hypothetical protein